MKIEKDEISISRAFIETKKEHIVISPEIDILESAAKSLNGWVIRNNSYECLFEFITVVSDLIEKIRDKKKLLIKIK